MSFLKSFEQKIENLIEGVFKNKFSAQIQPIELAKHVVNVMEDQKKVGADETIVPATYEILVNSVDFSELKPYLSEYEDVISRYVVNQCERRSYTPKGSLKIKFAVDDDLGIGFFQIIVVSSTPIVPEMPSGKEPAPDYREERKSIFAPSGSTGRPDLISEAEKKVEPSFDPELGSQPQLVPDRLEELQDADVMAPMLEPSAASAVEPPLKQAVKPVVDPKVELSPQPAVEISVEASDATKIFDTKESEQLIALTARVAPRPRTKKFFLIRTSDGAKIPLTRPVISLGRSKQNDLAIDSDSVSRKHAELLLRDGKFMLVDLGSTNGTMVNGETITSTTLKNNDVIELSTERFKFIIEEHE